MCKPRLALAILGLLFCLASHAGGKAQAQPQRAPWTYGSNLRAYFFSKGFRKGIDQTAFAVGGNFHAQGDLLRGLGVGLTYGTAQPLGLNSTLPARVDPGLPGTTLNALEELYAQYRDGFALLRLGRQIIRTPWANPADSRMVPNAFQGIALTDTGAHGWSFNANRMVRFKSRVSASFEASDLLSPKPTAGQLSLGVSNASEQHAVQVWYYDFYGTAQLGYVEAVQRFDRRARYRPFVEAQYIAEAGTTVRLSANVNAHGYGIGAGVVGDRGDLTVSYNDVPAKAGDRKS